MTDDFDWGKVNKEIQEELDHIRRLNKEFEGLFERVDRANEQLDNKQGGR